MAAPGEPLILNNVAEALNALPAGQRDSIAAKKLVALGQGAALARKRFG